MKEISADIIIVGGGTGGTAAALQAAKLRRKVIIIEECDWLGGQLTSQAVSAPDEHPHIEYFGGTKSYYQFRNGVRQHYANNNKLNPAVFDYGKSHFNPGNCWVSKVGYEPPIGVKVLNEMLLPFIENIEIFYNSKAISAEVIDDRIISINVQSSNSEIFKVSGRYFLDATELGDLLKISGTEYVTGTEAKSKTQEPDGYDSADPGNIQSFTYPFIVEYRPGENHTIEKPRDYEALKALQQYNFNDGAIRKLFSDDPGEWSTLWTYRRLIDHTQFVNEQFPNDICMINTASNDYRGPSVIDKTSEEADQVLDEARRAALGYLYWIQTEAPRHDGNGVGYPELKPRPDQTGTPDACAKLPYYRESRRAKTRTTIREQDIVVKDSSGAWQNEGPRAKNYSDSVGIGWYHLDCHKTCTGETGRYWPTRPFQIPLGALTPVRMKNLIPACKNIGTTHLSNGAYRLHPIEWAIGEAAASYAHEAFESESMQQFYRQSGKIAEVQKSLLKLGAPIFWFIDVPVGDADFTVVQMLAIAGTFKDEKVCDLKFRPDDILTQDEAAAWNAAEYSGKSRREAANNLYRKLLM